MTVDLGALGNQEEAVVAWSVRPKRSRRWQRKKNKKMVGSTFERVEAPRMGALEAEICMGMQHESPYWDFFFWSQHQKKSRIRAQLGASSGVLLALK